MKTKIVSLISALLAGLFAFNVVGCTKRVSAQNLLDGVTPQAVEGLEADEEFVLSQMQFSVNLFKGSVNQEKNQNTLISPLSIMIALALAANGADGETLAQMSLAWVLQTEGVTSVLVGASKPSQIIDNLNAVNSKPFTSEQLKKHRCKYSVR